LSSPASRIQELDALRGIAAIAVMLFHFTYRFGELYGYQSTPPVQFTQGSYGVQLFFLISGFVIFMTLNRTQRPLDFVVSRTSRLYPTYWAALISTFTIVSVFGLPGRELGWFPFLANFTMMQSFVPGVSSVDGVYWTLAVELCFYCVMFGVYTCNQMQRIEWIGLLWIGLSLVEEITPLRDVFIGKLLNLFLILNYAYLFVGGICFYKIFTKTATKLTYATLIASVTMVPVFTPVDGLLAVFISYGIFGLFLTGNLRVLNARLFVFMGTISYALYLVHQNIGYVVMLEIRDRGHSENWGIVGAMVVAITLATAITYLVEKPLISLIRSHYKNWKERGPVLASGAAS
jgi:peptidoglycan/LPS O-acetylase OafA/YrhL